jgi:hypothetical protein
LELNMRRLARILCFAIALAAVNPVMASSDAPSVGWFDLLWEWLTPDEGCIPSLAVDDCGVQEPQ